MFKTPHYNIKKSIGEIISIFKWYIIRQSRTHVRIKLYIRVYICTLKNLGLGIFLFKKTTSGHLARDFASFELRAIARCRLRCSRESARARPFPQCGAAHRRSTRP